MSSKYSNMSTSHDYHLNTSIDKDTYTDTYESCLLKENEYLNTLLTCKRQYIVDI